MLVFLITAEGETFWNVKRYPGNGSRQSRYLVKNKEYFSEYVHTAILILKKHAIRLNIEGENALMNQ
jgi:hypothetical protein